MTSQVEELEAQSTHEISMGAAGKNPLDEG
jgi:hypothetical protein